jgi:hypothetical protein
LDEDYTDNFFETLESRGSVDSNHSYISSIYGKQGSGKSLASISCCSVLDPNFSVDNIFFNFDDVVNNRHKFKPHSAIIVDEQTESYGLDSHRVNIVLQALKEQLRKRSIHFFFCSPTLKEEHRSSQYVLETLFIDYEEKMTYCAYKTRELLTLGYVRIPHPLLLGVSKKLLDEYEAKKDAHLDKLTGVKQLDEVEDRARLIMASPVFLKAEAVYKKKFGYVPTSMLWQIISKLFPEFKSGVMVGELVNRIKFNKELTGDWEISGVQPRKKK